MGPAAHGDRRGRAGHTLIACVALSAVGCVVGCGGSRPAGQAPARDARSSGQLSMREPPANAASNQPQLGTLQPVAVPERSEQAAEPSATPSTAQIAPLRIASSPAPVLVSLRGRDLTLPSGAVIHHVPRGVSVRSVAEVGSKDPVLEFVDPHGERVALLKETALGRVALGSGPPLLEATTTIHVRSQRDDWAKTRVSMVTDRFRSDTHLYTLERRSSGTDWIMSGLELASHH